MAGRCALSTCSSVLQYLHTMARVPVDAGPPPPADPASTSPQPTTPSSSRSTPPTPPPPSPQGPTSPEPTAQGGAFIHGLIGLSSGGFAETVRNSISSRTWRECKESKEFSEVKKDKAGDHAPVLYMGPHGAHPRRLLTLPPELLLAILQQLDLADIMRLRKTCKHLHALASPEQIRTLMGPAQLRMQLLGHCKTCLRHDPFRSGLLQPALNDPAYPLASSCIDCAVKARDPRIKVGRALMLANFDTAWVCRYCGLPIIEGAAFGHEQFHRFCYKRYNDRLLLFFLLGWLQWGLGIVAAALAWKYHRHAVLVFAPTVVSKHPCLGRPPGADLPRPTFSCSGSAWASSSLGETDAGRTIAPWSSSWPSSDSGSPLFTTLLPSSPAPGTSRSRRAHRRH